MFPAPTVRTLLKHCARPVLQALLIASCGLGLAPSASAASFTVAMTVDWTFSPDFLKIHVGDKVTWVNQDDVDYHDSFCPNTWSSGQLNYNQQWSVTFPVQGTFDYEDTRYYIVGMTGTIQVSTTAPPPILSDVARFPDGTFQCTVSNLVVGQTNLLQVSSNLVNWTSIYTNVATGDSYQFLNNSSGFSRRFYRALVLP